MLSFGKGNAKLGKNVFTFSLPAGYTCPSALDCLSKADKETGKIKDGPNTVFRCFAASQEALYKNVRDSRWSNFDQLKVLAKEGMVELIQNSLPKKANIVRIHVSGDFFNEKYFLAWLEVAKKNNGVLFYFYTKQVQYVVKYKELFPKNFVYTCSIGGKNDNLIELNNLRFAEVVYSEQEAINKGLDIDHDDSHAMEQGDSFALLIHGTQPKGSEAAKAKSLLNGLGSYSRKISLTTI